MITLAHMHSDAQDENARKCQVEVKQGTRRKLQQMQEKAGKSQTGIFIAVNVFTCDNNPSKVSIPQTSSCGYCLLSI